MASAVESADTSSSTTTTKKTKKEKKAAAARDSVSASIVAGHDLTHAAPVFSHDAKYLFCCCADVVRVFCVKAATGGGGGGGFFRDLRGHRDSVTSVCLHPRNRFQIFSSSLDDSIVLWDYEDGLLLRRFALDLSAIPHAFHHPYRLLSLYLPRDATEGGGGGRGRGGAAAAAAGNDDDGGVPSAYVLIAHDGGSSSRNRRLLRGKLPGPSDPAFFSPRVTVFRDLAERSHFFPDLIDFGYDGRLVVVADGNRFLTVYDADTEKVRRHENRKELETATSIACHPRAPTVLVGCRNGKILVVSDVDRDVVTRVVYHWHSLPVLALRFTRRGTHFLSGGHECVLVRWNLKAVADRQYVPRLGAAVRRIAVSPNNDFYSTSLSDNSVAVFGSTRQPVAVFGGMVKCPFKRAPDDGRDVQVEADADVPSIRSSAVPTGLHLDPRTNCLVLNGRLGHLQFFDVAQNRNLRSLDILNLNFVSPDSVDRGQVLAEVKLIAFDSRGDWLITVEQWKTVEISQQLRLKVWRYETNQTSSSSSSSSSSSQGTFSLHTVINKPHWEEITQIAFRPYGEFYGNETALFATASRDGTFKLWALEEEEEEEEEEKAKEEEKMEKNEKGSFWANDLTATFQNHIPVDLDFSEDGSILGVAFGRYVTLWTTDTGELKDTHMNPDKTDPSPVRQLLFGRVDGDSSHLVVYRTRRSLVVYDVLTLSVLWFQDVGVARLLRDPASPYFVAFAEEEEEEAEEPSSSSSSKSSSLFVFKPSSDELVDEVRWNRRRRRRPGEEDDAVIGAVFVPRKPTSSSSSSSSPAWLKRSRLLYLNAKQELMEIGKNVEEEEEEEGEEEEEEEVGVRVQRLEQRSLFGALMMAEERTSDVVAPANVEFSASAASASTLSLPTRAFLDGPLSTPAHVLPPVSTLCKEMHAMILGKGRGGGGGGGGGDADLEESSSADAEGVVVASAEEDSGEEVRRIRRSSREERDFWDSSLSRASALDLSWLKK